MHSPDHSFKDAESAISEPNEVTQISEQLVNTVVENTENLKGTSESTIPINNSESEEMSRSDFSVDKLKGSENYHDWAFAMTNYLTMKGWSKCIQVRVSNVAGASASAEVAAETDETKLNQSKACLALSVETSLFVHIRDCESALKIWKRFQQLYEDRGLLRKIGLLRTLISLRLDESDGMQQYIDNIMTTASKLMCVGFDLQDE